MGLLIALPKPVHRNVGVDLGSGQATVTKNFLHGPKISPSLQQDGYNRTDLAWVNPVSPYSQEQSRPASSSYQRRPSPAEPIVDGKGSWNSEGNGTLLVSLANDAEGPSIRIHVVDVQPGKLP